MQPENQAVGRKLVIATLLMFSLPIAAYFLSYHLLFSNKANPDNWAGGVAILTVNIIVGGYCYMALVEDSEEDKNDSRGPRVGIYKERTD